MDKKNVKIAVIGLGYVGLPLAIEFNKNFSTIGFDLDKVRIDELNNQYDRTNELSENDLDLLKNLYITANQPDISQSNVYVVTVPTPVDKNNKPDLKPILKASEMIGKYLKKNDTVIYESTVFPGCTDEICVPILERESNFGGVFIWEYYDAPPSGISDPGEWSRDMYSIINTKKTITNTILENCESMVNSVKNNIKDFFYTMYYTKLF